MADCSYLSCDFFYEFQFPTSPQFSFLPNSSVHLLAYFNDYESIEIILKEIELGSLETFLNFNKVEFQQLTPIDIAGLNKCE